MSVLFRVEKGDLDAAAREGGVAPGADADGARSPSSGQTPPTPPGPRPDIVEEVEATAVAIRSEAAATSR